MGEEDNWQQGVKLLQEKDCEYWYVNVDTALTRGTGIGHVVCRIEKMQVADLISALNRVRARRARETLDGQMAIAAMWLICLG